MTSSSKNTLHHLFGDPSPAVRPRFARVPSQYSIGLPSTKAHLPMLPIGYYCGRYRVMIG